MYDVELEVKLKKWRTTLEGVNELFKNNDVPHYKRKYKDGWGCINDNNIRTLVNYKPTTRKELFELPDFGKIKVEKYGDEILDIIIKHGGGIFDKKDIIRDDEKKLKKIANNSNGKYNMSGKPWTEEENNILIREWLDGLSNRKIGHMLGRTESSINSRALKLKIYELKNEINFCSYCGKNLEKKDNFCSKCGKKIKLS